MNTASELSASTAQPTLHRTERPALRHNAHIPRWLLWVALLVLLALATFTLGWMLIRYEHAQTQQRIEEEAVTAAVRIHSALQRNVQDVQALWTPPSTEARPQRHWQLRAMQLLQLRREMVRVQQRSSAGMVSLHAQSPWGHGRQDLRHLPNSQAAATCQAAARTGAAAYSHTYFEVLSPVESQELMDVCVPHVQSGHIQGFTLITYSLRGILLEHTWRGFSSMQEVSFQDPDGTRLAAVGYTLGTASSVRAQQSLDLPPHVSLVLHFSGWHNSTAPLPNTGQVALAAMGAALALVVALLVRDGRARLRAEQALAAELSLKQAMERSLVTGLLARDRMGRITYVNPAFCQMVGFEAEQLIGLIAAPYWPAELATQYAQRLQQRLQGDFPPVRQGHELSYMHSSGTLVPVLVFEAALIDAAGQHTGWLSACVDMREQHRLRTLSQEAQERLQATAPLVTAGEIASTLSHELTQPLMAISSYANGSLNLLGTGCVQASVPQHDSTQGQSPDTSLGHFSAGSAHNQPPAADPIDTMPEWQLRSQLHDMRRAMQRIATQAERAGQVIQTVRNFLRRRTSASARSVTCAQQLIQSVLPLIHLQAHKAAVQVIIDMDEPTRTHPIECEPILIEQVLLNLARNAIQAMQDTPAEQRQLRLIARLHSSSAAAYPNLHMHVADTGSGISAQAQDLLFTPFFTTRAEGTGLGLNLCRTIIEQHGGTLAYQPNQPRGTVFYFSVPTHRPLGSPPPSGSANA